MKYYEQMVAMGCFSFREAVQLIGSETAAFSLLNAYIRKGYVVKIRRGLYSAVNLVDHEPVADRFAIASALSETAVVSHHAAFEYHGCANQVMYEVTVTSESRFNPFAFGGYRYRRFAPSIAVGIQNNSSRVSVTDLERTVLDGINDFEKDMGFEELIQCIKAVPMLNEQILVKYLDAYETQFLYQKTGFIMEHFREDFEISDCFLEHCRQNAGLSSRYLLNDWRGKKADYFPKWRLTTPENVWKMAEGGFEDAVV